MQKSLLALLCGVLFGAGLAAAGMTDPAKVVAFLDLLGVWDPTLILVMAAAVATTLVTFRFILRRDRPLLDGAFHLPSLTEIDRKLIIGALLFGAGWGLYGYCPGPSLGALVYGHGETVLFVGAMLAGMFGDWMIRRVRIGGNDD